MFWARGDSIETTVEGVRAHPAVDHVPFDLGPTLFDAPALVDRRLEQRPGGGETRAVVDVAPRARPVAGLPVAHGAEAGIEKDLARGPDDAALVAGIGEVGVIDMLPLGEVVQQLFVGHIKTSPPFRGHLAVNSWYSFIRWATQEDSVVVLTDRP